MLADAEPKDCDGSRPCAVERFQVYPGQARGGEEASPRDPEQNRQDEHHDLVHESPPQALTRYVGAEDFEVRRRGARWRRLPRISPARNVTAGFRRVRWLMGEDELNSPVVQVGGPTPGFSARTLAHLVGLPADHLVAAMISGNLSFIGPMKSKIQFIASPGPAVNPSSDIDLFTTTLPFPVLLSLTMRLLEGLPGCHPRLRMMTLRAPGSHRLLDHIGLRRHGREGAGQDEEDFVVFLVHVRRRDRRAGVLNQFERAAGVSRRRPERPDEGKLLTIAWPEHHRPRASHVCHALTQTTLLVERRLVLLHRCCRSGISLLGLPG